MATINVSIKGTHPLLMHSGQLADPTNYWTKELKKLTSKRQKTDEDYIAIMRVEFMGGLYHDKSIGVYVPGINVESCIWEGAKIKKRGMQVRQGLTCNEDRIPLTYVGPRNPDQLWDLPEFRDVRGARIAQNRVMRCRACFREWSLSFSLTYFADIIEPSSIREALDEAGRRIGLCDYHYRFGKFEVVVFEVTA